MFIIYALLILIGVYIAKSKSIDGSVKTIIIMAEIVFVVLAIVLEVIGG